HGHARNRVSRRRSGGFNRSQSNRYHRGGRVASCNCESACPACQNSPGVQSPPDQRLGALENVCLEQSAATRLRLAGKTNPEETVRPLRQPTLFHFARFLPAV